MDFYSEIFGPTEQSIGEAVQTIRDATRPPVEVRDWPVGMGRPPVTLPPAPSGTYVTRPYRMTAGAEATLAEAKSRIENMYSVTWNWTRLVES